MEYYVRKYKGVAIILVSLLIIGGCYYSKSLVRDRESIEPLRTVNLPVATEALEEIKEGKVEKDKEEEGIDIQEPLERAVETDNIKAKAPEIVSLEVPIYICGEVQNPGVYYVSSAGILNDVVNLAGGFTVQADTLAINLASHLEPNQKIIVPKKGQQIDKMEDSYDNIDNGQIIKNNKTNIETYATTKDSGGKININKATQEELMTLVGIGEVKANAIINYRENTGQFKSSREIKQVSGIGDKTFEKIEQFITTE